jgi:hypothetical protein
VVYTCRHCRWAPLATCALEDRENNEYRAECCLANGEKGDVWSILSGHTS